MLHIFRHSLEVNMLCILSTLVRRQSASHFFFTELTFTAYPFNRTHTRSTYNKLLECRQKMKLWDGWMDGWMDGWRMDDRRMDGWRMDDRRMDGWRMDDRRMDGWRMDDRRMDGWIDRWEIRLEIQSLRYNGAVFKFY
ncbi:hypothetical protein CHS0354_027022 [Potamilus streckersoni]|uniref:Uncharacterized protein n=1 Tax=Potamilus streckersoni TaxID=2493646 RepID=A0AAE0W2X2_9BIVA|nr:hypothetical protein CHS0354_027022 [Potamilus streckersoni]